MCVCARVGHVRDHQLLMRRTETLHEELEHTRRERDELMEVRMCVNKALSHSDIFTSSLSDFRKLVMNFRFPSLADFSLKILGSYVADSIFVIRSR